MYSYGSGISATMFSLVGRNVEGKFNLGRMQAQVRRLPLSTKNNNKNTLFMLPFSVHQG
jgi:hypothetical protein